MLDYRYVLEGLYTFRGKKMGSNWLLYISELEAECPEEKYVEVGSYEMLLHIKKFLVKNKNKMISSSLIRREIEDAIHKYDESYMGYIGDLFYILEVLEEDEECRNSLLMKELKRIFYEQ